MIGKGKLFDIISRTSDDVNNTDITIYNLLENFKIREEKFKIREEKFNKQKGEEK